MKQYQSLISQQNKFESLKNNQPLQPIMEYDYYFRQPIKQPITKKISLIHPTKNTQKSPSQKIVNNPTSIKNAEKMNPKKQKNQQQNNLIFEGSSQNRQNQQNKNQKEKSSLNKNKQPNSNNNVPINQSSVQSHQKQTKIILPHNPIYSSALFPQSESIKEKLKQNVQQQMLNNYYINKYSTIMSKMTNENIKIQLPSDLTQRSSFSNTKDKQSLMGYKKRKNFKEVMKRKNNNTADKLQITFSPIKQPQNINTNGKSPQKIIKNHNFIHLQQNQGDQKLSSSRRSNYSSPNSYRQKRSQKLSQPKNNKDSLRSSQNIRQSFYSGRTNNFQLGDNSPSRNRLNFKQSLKQKKSLYLQYEQNFNLYKKLESSIINELYSPSPKKIQKERFNQISFINRQLTKQEKKLLSLDQKQGIKGFYDQGFQSIQINQEQLDYDKIKSEMNNQSISDTFRNNQFDFLRQSIKKSILSNLNHSSKDSSFIQRNRNESSSKMSPNDSPQRSFISNKYKNESPQKSIQKQANWNPHFNSAKSLNKRYLNVELSRKKSQQSSRISPQRKYHSLEKTYVKRSNGKSPSKNFLLDYRQNNLSGQKLPINEQENDFQSQLQNNNQQTTEHNESYNQVSRKLGNQINLVEEAKNTAEYKAHHRKSSIHSVKSDGFYKDQSAVQSRFITENIHKSRNSNETVNDSPSESQEDVEFVPAANENLFAQKESQMSKQSSPGRKNLIQTVAQTRSRKPSNQYSFISDINSHHDFSMISRFSMTSQEGSMIIHKLENQITQNEFGPYQYALQSLRQLLYEHKTAWPIYVVGQKILEDRAEYEKKIEQQNKMIEDLKLNIHQIKIQQGKYENQNNKIHSNQFKILKLTRQLTSLQN